MFIFLHYERGVPMKYSNEHLWVKSNENIAEVGLTNFKRAKMGKIAFVDMPETDEHIDKGETIFSIEAAKTQGEFQSPLSGEIIECNEEVSEDPTILNKDAENIFIVKIRLDNPDEFEKLLSLEEYKKICAKQ